MDDCVDDFLMQGMDYFAVQYAATIMSSFNDNAAITYLATFIPGITDSTTP